MKTKISGLLGRAGPGTPPLDAVRVTPPSPPRPAATYAAVRRARRRKLTQPRRSRVAAAEALRTELLESPGTVAARAAKARASTDDLSFTSEDERPVSDICRRASSPRRWAERLFGLIREVQPHDCLEMGTSLGISAAYQAEALRRNGHGQLLTLERRPEFVAIARDGLARLGLDNTEVRQGAFQAHFPAVAWERPWDFVFVDGHHDEEATHYYFSTLLPHVASGALLVFDDITWSAGMKRAWRRISEDPHLFAAKALGRWGLCIVGEQVTDGRP